ncbi:MAG: hypothetical protein QF541_22165, partial [Lentisphaeria bacterium]|nr:hypothetical protein [Lentisphaeria bacterium]
TYMSYHGDTPRVYIYNIDTGRQEVLGDFPGMTFAPRFSPDGNKVIMSSAAMLSGHIEVGDAAVIGGHSGVVQFVKIGTMSMVGGFSKLGQDVCSFCIADGVPAETRVTNKIGMQRNGKSPEQIQAVANAFRVIFQSDLPIDAAVAALRDSAAEFAEVQTMLDFIAASERGLARPKKKSVD